MKITKNGKILALSSLFVITLSLVVCLIDATTSFNFGIHPILTFLFCLFVGFGALCFVLGILRKSSFQFFLSAILFGLSLVYVFILYVSAWWLIFIVLFVLFFVMAMVSYLTGSNKTEFALNDSPEYKNYKERKAEKKEEICEELPEIKSFKE